MEEEGGGAEAVAAEEFDTGDGGEGVEWQDDGADAAELPPDWLAELCEQLGLASATEAVRPTRPSAQVLALTRSAS